MEGENGIPNRELHDWTSVRFSQLHVGDHALNPCFPHVFEAAGIIDTVRSGPEWKWNNSTTSSACTVL
jgi:hypothetical protein